MSNVNSLEDCLVLLGAREPFDFNSKNIFTTKGSRSYNDLIDILCFLESQGVVSTVNIDKLDKIASLEY